MMTTDVPHEGGLKCNGWCREDEHAMVFFCSANIGAEKTAVALAKRRVFPGWDIAGSWLAPEIEKPPKLAGQDVVGVVVRLVRAA